MNKKLLLFPLVSCALLASCTEEGANDATNQTELPKQAQGKTVTFTAAPVSIETKSASTKVNVKPDGDNDILEWTSEDISFFFFGGNDNYYYEDFSVTVTDGFTGKQISMTGQGPDEEGSYGIYAISPAGDYFKDNVSPTSTVTISQEQTQTLSNGSYAHLSDYIFLYSNPDEVLEVDAASNSDGELEMNFSPLSSLLRFDISTTSAEPVTLNSITIKYVNGSGQGKLYRSATLNEYYGTLTGNTGDTYSDMTLNLPANTVISGSNTYNAYMAVFPSGGEGTLEITLNITSGSDNEDIIYECPAVNFTSGQRTQIDLTYTRTTDGDIVLIDGKNYVLMCGQIVEVIEINNKYFTSENFIPCRGVYEHDVPYFFRYIDIINVNPVCPDGWAEVDGIYLNSLDINSRRTIFSNLNLALGLAKTGSNSILNNGYFCFMGQTNASYQHSIYMYTSSGDMYYETNVGSDMNAQIRCRQL